MTYLREKNTFKILDILRKIKYKNIYLFNDGLITKKDQKKINQKNIFVSNDGLVNRTKINQQDKYIHQTFRKRINKYKKKYKIKVIMPQRNLHHRFAQPYALSKVFKKYSEVIVLEDDTIPNKSFFKFCSQLLIKFRNDKRISIISGNNFLNYKNFKRRNNDSYFFSKFTTTWGWATWKDRWEDSFDINMNDWPKVKKEGWMKDILLNDKSEKFLSKYLHRRFKLIDQDWDRAWQFGCLINGRLTIFPCKNLITSVGQDEFATHKNPKKWDRLPLEEMKFPLKHPKIIVADSLVDNFLTKEGFSKPDIIYRIKNKIRKYLLS